MLKCSYCWFFFEEIRLLHDRLLQECRNLGVSEVGEVWRCFNDGCRYHRRWRGRRCRPSGVSIHSSFRVQRTQVLALSPGREAHDKAWAGKSKKPLKVCGWCGHGQQMQTCMAQQPRTLIDSRWVTNVFYLQSSLYRSRKIANTLHMEMRWARSSSFPYNEVSRHSSSLSWVKSGDQWSRRVPQQSQLPGWLESSFGATQMGIWALYFIFIKRVTNYTQMWETLLNTVSSLWRFMMQTNILKLRACFWHKETSLV